MNCHRCGNQVPEERAEFLLETSRPMTCLGCSTEAPKVCFTQYDHKTAGTLVVVGNDQEKIRMASRAYRRAR
jgi:hypothetical protein